MPNKHVWMVRGGDYNELIPVFKEKRLVAIGWRPDGDWKDLQTREQFKAYYREAYPEYSELRIGNNAGQCFRFAREMATGDFILTFDKSTRKYLAGEVDGTYRFAPEEINEKYPQVRDVKWQTTFSRDDLSVPAKNALGGALTVFSVDSHLQEIEALIKGEEIVDETEEEEGQVPYDNQVKANADELIADKISGIDPYVFQGLVAALLRAMGFRTIISRPGPDRGVDIIAHPDAFGFETPLIKTQVKHRAAKASGPDMRNFVATIRPGENGLFISTGGFTREAEEECRRARHPIKTMDRDAFVDLLIEHYDNLEPEFQALIPLRKVYIPTGL